VASREPASPFPAREPLSSAEHASKVILCLLNDLAAFVSAGSVRIRTVRQIRTWPTSLGFYGLNFDAFWALLALGSASRAGDADPCSMALKRPLPAEPLGYSIYARVRIHGRSRWSRGALRGEPTETRGRVYGPGDQRSTRRGARARIVKHAADWKQFQA
jgi:hypothetical protein